MKSSMNNKVFLIISILLVTLPSRIIFAQTPAPSPSPAATPTPENFIYRLEPEYSTYLGGSSGEPGWAVSGMAVDSLGCAYVIGFTDSNDFPTKNPYQAAYSGNRDISVTKFSSSGSSLIYSTYLGGNNEDDLVYDIDVDSWCCAYVTGFTESRDFPTENPYQPSNAGHFNGFVTKFSSSGSSLIYSTYLGGSVDSRGLGVTVDSSGSAYVTGFTAAPDFPTANPYQSSMAANGDIYATKFSSSGSSLIYSTYLGGSWEEDGYDIAIDSAHCAYVTGSTYSLDFPTKNPFSASKGGGLDAIVTKFSSSGSSLIYSTYLGGLDDNAGRGIVVDSACCAYIAGSWYVVKFSSTGSSFIYSWLAGEGGSDIAIDTGNKAYVIGSTDSSDYPLKNPYQASNAGGSDSFITVLSSSGEIIVFSTYFGGSGRDEGRGIAVDCSNCVYVTGETNSFDFPTLDPYQSSNAGGDDMFISKLKWIGYETTPTPTPAPSPTPVYTRIYAYPLETDPGWTAESDWAFGDPLGAGGEHGNPDPIKGYIGDNVYGYNLTGDYHNELSPTRRLTTSAINCSQVSETRLKFRRWLNVERSQYDHAYLEVSSDGTNWVLVWENPDTETADSSWQEMDYGVSAVADGESTVFLRWGMGPTDSSWRYSGWNIDDIEIWGLWQTTPPPTPTPTPPGYKTPTPPPCPPEMIAYWQAEGDASDYLGHHDGTVMGGTTFEPGTCQLAFCFRGLGGDYVSIPSSSDFDLHQADDKSFAFWWNANTSKDNLTLLSRRASSVGPFKGLLFRLGSSGYLLHLLFDHWAEFAISYSPGEWHHTVITKDGSAWKVYHNGLEVPVSSSMGWPYGGDATKDLPFLIGKDGDNPTDNFDGLIDEVAVYTNALTSQEVLELYQSSCHYCSLMSTLTPTPTPYGYKTPTPTPTSTPTSTSTPSVTPTPTPPGYQTPTPPPCPEGMIAYWQAEGDASDYLGHHDGTVMGGTTFEPGTCQLAFCFRGLGGDYVSIPSSSDFDLHQADDKSFALWWNANTSKDNLTLLSRRASGVSPYKGLLSRLDSSGYLLHLRLNHWAEFAISYSPGEWHHTVITKDGSTWKVYHNGVEVPVSRSLGWPYYGDATEDLPFLIGKDGDNPTDNFDGLIDEVAVYTEALTSQEVLELYQSSCHYCSLIPTLTPPGYKTPTPTPTPYGYKTPTPTPTSTPNSTPTPSVTPTPTPPGYQTPTPTCGPTVPLRKLAIESGDYDGDGTDDVAIFRGSSGLWAIRNLTRVLFGVGGDLPVSGDYNGDGITEIAVFSPGSGVWSLRGITWIAFGAPGDIPVPADYDDDGSADIGIFRNGFWAIRNVTRVFFGSADDWPVPGDFSGRGKKEIGIYRDISALWAIRGVTRTCFGGGESWALPGDYDGNGSWDIAVFRAHPGLWAIRDLTRVYFGKCTDWPVPADYDGDQKDDLGLFRPSTGQWVVREVTRLYFGAEGDAPVTR